MDSASSSVYTDECRSAAVDYRERCGWSVIPLRGKVPTGPWAQFQERRPTMEEIERQEWPGIGVVTGAVSGVVVLDADSARAVEELKRRGHPPTPMARTARGVHAYFKHPGEELPTQIGLGDGLDLKGDKSYVVAPPSRHPSGANYEWIIPPAEAEPAELPEWIMASVRVRGRKIRAEDVGEKIANGSRNRKLFSLAGTLRRRGLDEAAIFAALLGINETKCETPLDEAEVRKIAESAARYEPAEPLTDDGSVYSDHTGGEFDRNKSRLPIKTVEEVVSEAGEGPSWVIENVLARDALTDFSGLAKKGGKTTYWCHAIAAGARGDDHAGFATEPAKYLYLTEQGNNFADALRDSGLVDHPDHIRVVQFKDVSAVEWDSLIREAGATTKRLGFDALIVDTFAVFAKLKGSEENDSGAVGDRMRVLRLVAQTHHIAVALVRHAGKDGTPRGSSAFEAEADICVTISRPEGRHAPTVRKLSGVGRYGEWERNIQLHEGRYISLGTDDKVEFNKAVKFVKATLPDSPEAGMKKQGLLDRREGPDKDISSATLARALQWLVKQGDVGEKQLMNERGKPKVYWLAFKPRGGGKEGGDIYFDQTPPPTNGFDRNKPEAEATPRNDTLIPDYHAKVEDRMAGLEARCTHGFGHGKGCYVCDPEHPYKKGAVS
jgi:hypothetical protein